MGSLFSRQKKSRVTDHDRAVLQLKQQKDKLRQYQKKLMVNLENDRLLAKRLLQSGRKDRAKLLLKKKRYQEELISKTDGQLDNIEQLIHDIEFSQIQQQVLDKLKVGGEALKKMNELFTIEDIEKIMDETQEGVDKQREIDALLGGCLTDEDNEAVEEELAQIIGESMPVAPSEEVTPEPEIVDEISLPEVPDGDVQEETQTAKSKPLKQKQKVLVVEAS